MQSANPDTWAHDAPALMAAAAAAPGDVQKVRMMTVLNAQCVMFSAVHAGHPDVVIEHSAMSCLRSQSLQLSLSCYLCT